MEKQSNSEQTTSSTTKHQPFKILRNVQRIKKKTPTAAQMRRNSTSTIILQKKNYNSQIYRKLSLPQFEVTRKISQVMEEQQQQQQNTILNSKKQQIFNEEEEEQDEEIEQEKSEFHFPCYNSSSNNKQGQLSNQTVKICKHIQDNGESFSNDLLDFGESPSFCKGLPKPSNEKLINYQDYEDEVNQKNKEHTDILNQLISLPQQCNQCTITNDV